MSITKPGESGDRALEKAKHVEAVKPNADVERAAADVGQVFNTSHDKVGMKDSIEAKDYYRPMLQMAFGGDMRGLRGQMQSLNLPAAERNDLVKSLFIRQIDSGRVEAAQNLLAAFPLPPDVLLSPEVTATVIHSVAHRLYYQDISRAEEMIRGLNLPDDMIQSAVDEAVQLSASLNNTPQIHQTFVDKLHAAYPQQAA